MWPAPRTGNTFLRHSSPSHWKSRLRAGVSLGSCSSSRGQRFVRSLSHPGMMVSKFDLLILQSHMFTSVPKSLAKEHISSRLRRSIYVSQHSSAKQCIALDTLSSAPVWPWPRVVCTLFHVCARVCCAFPTLCSTTTRVQRDTQTWTLRWYIRREYVQNIKRPTHQQHRGAQVTAEQRPDGIRHHNRKQPIHTASNICFV